MTGGGTSTHARPSNEELLYDPNMDDADERWVNQNRHRSATLIYLLHRYQQSETYF